jgi:hypothetical protein
MYRYFQNPFLSVTNSSYKRMLLMARDHRDKLMEYASTDQQLQPILERVSGSFTEFESAYRKVSGSAGVYKGYTSIMESLLEELSSKKIKQWDIRIQNVFIEGDPKHTMLLPKRRTPFQSGAYEMRIHAVSTLSEIIKKFPELADVSADIDEFYGRLNQARTDQQRLEALDQSSRLNVEKAREKLATEMHRAMSFLLFKHYNNTAEVSRYYEMKYLQSPNEKPESTLKSFQLAGKSNMAIFDGELTANSYITFKNNSLQPLKIFTTSLSTPTYEDGLLVMPGETHSFYSNELNDGSGFTRLIVQNEASQAAIFLAGYEETETE